MRLTITSLLAAQLLCFVCLRIIDDECVDVSGQGGTLALQLASSWKSHQDQLLISLTMSATAFSSTLTVQSFVLTEWKHYNVRLHG